MMGDTKENNLIVHKSIETPHVLKNMKQYLHNPKTCKDLLEALRALPKPELFDLHEEEITQVNKLYRELEEGEKGKNKNTDTSDVRSEIRELVRLKGNIQNILGKLDRAFQELPIEDSGLEEKEKSIYEHKVRSLINNLMLYVEKYKKQFTPEDVDFITKNCRERIDLVKEIENGVLANLLSFLLQRHLYTGEDTLDLALQHLMEIHGEDITRPLIGESTISKEYMWNSLLFMKYGFNEIDITEFQLGISLIIKKNNEKIQRSLKPFIPLYTLLRSILEESKEDPSNNLVSSKEEIVVSHNDWNRSVKELQKYNKENHHLHTLRDADSQDLEKRLQVLREMCTFKKIGNNLLQ